MARKNVLIENPNILDNERGYLSKRYTGGTELNVENAEGWANNDVIVVGTPGFERTEAGFVSSAGTLVLTLQAALNLPHNKDDPLFLSFFDQYSLEYQATEGGAWTVFSDMPKNIEWDDQYSQYLTADGTYYAFRWRFYNSKTGAYSAYSPTMPAAGWSRQQAGTMVKNVRRLTKDPKGKLATVEEVLDLLDDGQDHIKSIRKKWWFLRVEPSSFTATQAGVSKYGLPSDFESMDYVLYHYTSGSVEEVYRLRYKKRALMDMLQSDQTQDDDDEASYWTDRAPDSSNSKGYIDLYPTPETANQGYKPIYFKEFTTIDSVGDTTECPRPEALENHAASIILYDNDRERAAARCEARRDRIIEELKMQNRRVFDSGNNFLQFRGQRGFSKLHQRGSRLSRDTLHENYFTDEFR